MTIQKKFIPKRKTLSGGIRVEEATKADLIELTCEAVVIWGLHNSVHQSIHVKAGYRFYPDRSVGGWHDIIPFWHRKDGRYFIKLPHDDLGGDKLHGINKKKGLIVRELWSRDDDCFEWRDIYKQEKVEALK